MAVTPLQGDTVPDNSASPLTGTHLMTYGTAVEKRTIMKYASAAARDTAIPLGSRIEGMHAWLNDTNIEYVWDGTVWVEVAGKRQRQWQFVRPSTDAAATNLTFIHTGVGGTISSAPIGDWLITFSLSVSGTVTASGNVRFAATTNGVFTNLNADTGLDLIASTRTIATWGATLQTTVVSSLVLDSYVLGSAGSISIYAGSRAVACYLGPR